MHAGHKRIYEILAGTFPAAEARVDAHRLATETYGADAIGPLMDNSRRVHTLESATASAQQYKTRSEFLRGDNAACQWAQRNGVMDQVCAHMPAVLNFHNLESVMALAQQYQTRTAFLRHWSGAYWWARQNKVLDLVCAHMPKHAQRRSRP